MVSFCGHICQFLWLLGQMEMMYMLVYQINPSPENTYRGKVTSNIQCISKCRVKKLPARISGGKCICGNIASHTQQERSKVDITFTELNKGEHNADISTYSLQFL